jgi:hypothetical protein
MKKESRSRIAKPDHRSETLTIAAIRSIPGSDEVECLFYEKEQIYRLNPTRALSKTLSKAAVLKKNTPVNVSLDIERARVESITPASTTETKALREKLPLLKKPAPAERINVSALDPIAYNLADLAKWPIFKACTKVIPDYNKAKQVFDYCAAQSCHLPTPPVVTPCIPFQYVRDGCFARAHKMRWIITEHFNYCCEKIFSYAEQLGPSVLAVKADKWGGCCVVWWYHVAPLVRVRVRIGKIFFQTLMVIDPGMFDQPVLLSQWLQAQENTQCNPEARVVRTSIQPGSAYTPGPNGTYTTDPDYSQTDTSLILNQNKITCP